MTEELFHARVVTVYSQVSLFDAGSKDACPKWKTGTENVILGPRGIVLATATDSPVDISVYATPDLKRIREPNPVLCLSTEIEVGPSGLVLGSVPAAEPPKIPWPAGRTTVVIYTNGLGESATQVKFYLHEVKL
jgi:hypothetical protein